MSNSAPTPAPAPGGAPAPSSKWTLWTRRRGTGWSWSHDGTGRQLEMSKAADKMGRDAPAFETLVLPPGETPNLNVRLSTEDV